MRLRGSRRTSGSGGGGDAHIVAVDDAEAVGCRLPVGARLGDLVMVAAGEVPPHHDLILEGLTADEEQQRTLPAGGLNALACVPEVEHVAVRDVMPVDLHIALDEHDRVFPVGAQRQTHTRSGRHGDLGTDDRGVHGRGRGHVGERAEYDGGRGIFSLLRDEVNLRQ